MSQGNFYAKYTGVQGSGGGGGFTLPADMTISDTVDAAGLTTPGMALISDDASGSNMVYGSTDTTLTATSTPSVYLVTGNNSDTGSTPPTGNININTGGNNGTGGGSASGNVSITTGGVDTGGGSTGTIGFQTGPSDNTAVGGINIATGTSNSGNVGIFTITGGDSATGNPGSITITAGHATDPANSFQGGAVNIHGGQSSSSTSAAGAVNIFGGNASGGVGGSIQIQAGPGPGLSNCGTVSILDGAGNSTINVSATAGIFFADDTNTQAALFSNASRVLYDNSSAIALDFTNPTGLIMGGNFFQPPTRSSDPGGATAGAVYFNTTSHKLKVFNGTTWETITST